MPRTIDRLPLQVSRPPIDLKWYDDGERWIFLVCSVNNLMFVNRRNAEAHIDEWMENPNKKPETRKAGESPFMDISNAAFKEGRFPAGTVYRERLKKKSARRAYVDSQVILGKERADKINDKVTAELEKAKNERREAAERTLNSGSTTSSSVAGGRATTRIEPYNG